MSEDLQRRLLSSDADQQMHNLDQEKEEDDCCWNCSSSRGSSRDIPDSSVAIDESINSVNEYWVDVPSTLTKPLLNEFQSQSTKVRLETMPQWQLTATAVLLAGGIFFPQAIIKIANITDDDFVTSKDGCNPSRNGTVDDDRAVSTCQWEADIRLDISIGLIIFTLGWLFIVIREWKCKRLRLQHGAVLLFLFGQFLLEDPIDAYRVRELGHYSAFTVGGLLRPIQQYGCGLMTFATLLLIDYCRRANGPKSIGCGKFLLFFISSLWPRSYYSIDWSNFWPPFSGTKSYSDVVAAGFCTAVMVVSLIQILSAYTIVRNASYMTHRYRNLLLRLFLPFAFANLLIVTLWAESFAVLYVTTLALPVFIAFAHLPPGEDQSHVFIRDRSIFLRKFFEEQKRKNAIQHSQTHLSNQNGNLNYHYINQQQNESSFKIPELINEASRMVETMIGEVDNVVGMGVGTVGNMVGVDMNMGPQKFVEDDEYFSFSEDEEDGTDYIVIEGRDNTQRIVREEHVDERRSDYISCEEQEPHRQFGGNKKPSSSPTSFTHDADMGIERIAFCIESALWSAQFSNLVYWDPPAENGSEFRPTINGCGPLNPSNIEGLLESGVSLLKTIYNEDTLTMVHVYEDGRQIIRDSAQSSNSIGVSDVSSKTPKSTHVSAHHYYQSEEVEKEKEKENLSETKNPIHNTREKLKEEEDDIIGDEEEKREQSEISSTSSLSVKSHSSNVDASSLSRTLWVSFRGTASKKEISKDLDTKQVPLWIEEDGVVTSSKPKAHCHRGFWSAYTSIRYQLHTLLGEELTRRSDRRPICVVFCGHSLGGALASLAALDFSLVLRKGKTLMGIPEQIFSSSDSVASSGSLRLSEPLETEPASPFTNPLFAIGAKKSLALVECFSFGSPRIGDLKLSLLAKQHIPRCWRVVYEGDVVTAMPRVHCGKFKLCEICTPRCFCGNICGLHEYKHIGVPVFIGRKSAIGGDLLINPSQIERLAYLHWARSIDSHLLQNYIRGLVLATRRIKDTSDFNRPRFESPPPNLIDSPTYRGDLEATRLSSINV